MSTKEQRAEWRRRHNGCMPACAILTLLADVDRLEAQLSKFLLGESTWEERAIAAGLTKTKIGRASFMIDGPPELLNRFEEAERERKAETGIKKLESQLAAADALADAVDAAVYGKLSMYESRHVITDQRDALTAYRAARGGK